MSDRLSMKCFVSSILLSAVAAYAGDAADTRDLSVPATQPVSAPKNPQVDTTGTLVVNSAVAFSAVATSTTGAAVTFSWDFGDGSPKDSRQKPSHIYARPGTFTVTLTITEADNPASVVKTLTVVITDAIKTPRFLANFDFTKSGKDTLFLQGVLKVPTGDAVQNKNVNIDIGGILTGFTLSDKSAAKITSNANVVSGVTTASSSVDGSFTMFVRHRPAGVAYTDARFVLKLKNGTLLPALADEFVFNRDADKEPVRIVAKITFLGLGVTSNGNTNSLYQSTLTPNFSAKKDQKGKLR